MWQRVADIVVNELLPDSDWLDRFVAFAECLRDKGITFYSPGGSVQRWVSILVTEQLFGEEQGVEHLLNDPDVAKFVELFSLEIKRRLDARDG